MCCAERRKMGCRTPWALPIHTLNNTGYPQDVTLGSNSQLQQLPPTTVAGSRDFWALAKCSSLCNVSLPGQDLAIIAEGCWGVSIILSLSYFRKLKGTLNHLISYSFIIVLEVNITDTSVVTVWGWNWSGKSWSFQKIKNKNVSACR